jgi:hypothetical protein
MAYPSFNVNEIIAIADLYEGTAKATGRPIVVFNGELDRIRSGCAELLNTEQRCEDILSNA